MGAISGLLNIYSHDDTQPLNRAPKKKPIQLIETLKICKFSWRPVE